MAKNEKKAAESAKPAGSLKDQLATILHSNGLDGNGKAVGEILAAVEAHTGESLTDKEESEE